MMYKFGKVSFVVEYNTEIDNQHLRRGGPSGAYVMNLMFLF